LPHTLTDVIIDGYTGELCSGSTKDFELASTHAPFRYKLESGLVSSFIKSRRQGLSPLTIKYYRSYLTRAGVVVGFNITGQSISHYLDSLKCSTGGKHAYYRALRAFYTWLYSPKSGYGLNVQDNPILMVDSPKVGKRILPSLTESQIDTLINGADNLRDRCIVSLLADSGIRLSELTSIKIKDIDWDSYTLTIIGKGNKQRRAPFTDQTAGLLKAYLSGNGHHRVNIWGINWNGVQKMLRTLGYKTGIKCNAHSFRRGFACNLHRKGLSTLDIMHLGGWSELSMVLRYTAQITFDDCLKHYKALQ
jgi:integrase